MSSRHRLPLPQSFYVAARGACEAVREQRNLQIHLAATVGVIVAGAVCQINLAEWIVLLFCIAGVITTELLNTAVETVVDLVSPDHHELARKSKDIAAAAVLFSSVMAAVIGGIILFPPLWRLVSG